MIDPRAEDIGRSVIYQASYPDAPREEGVITGFNERSVFVRYETQHSSQSGQPTSREDLEWAYGKS